MAKDFSIVAWGNNGPITLTHMDGLASMSFTDLPDDADPEDLPDDADPEELEA